MYEAASSYPLLNAFWTMLIFFGWIIWIWMLFVIFADLFPRSDIGGWAKAGWVVFVLVLPLIGVLTYLIAYGKGMDDRRAKRARAEKEGFDEYVKSVAESPSGDGASEISRAKKLLDTGAITPEEFETLKQKALSH